MSKSHKPVLERIHPWHVYLQIRAVLLGDRPEKTKERISRPEPRELEYDLPSFFPDHGTHDENSLAFFFPPHSHRHKGHRDDLAKE